VAIDKYSWPKSGGGTVATNEMGASSGRFR
jgi:hypothetical protein